jgi:hypothetical protein
MKKSCLAQIRARLNELESLKINSSNLRNEFGGIESLSNLLKDNASITHLDLSQSKASKYIASIIQYNTHIFEINLLIGEPEAVYWIANALKVNSTLKKIKITGDVRNEGARLIADAINVNSTLQVISLVGCNIGPVGANWLAEAIKQNATLLEIYLGGNHIGEEGAKCIAEAIKQNHTLQEISISAETGEEGVKCIAHAIQQNSTLKAIYLSFYEISTQFLKLIAEAIKMNYTLQTIRIREFNLTFSRSSVAEGISLARS